MLNYQLLGLVKRFPHEDIFLNSSVENPGLLGDVSKCPIGCDGALKKVHLKDKIKETEKLYLLDILCTVRNSKNFFFLLIRLLLDLATADRMPYSYICIDFHPFSLQCVLPPLQALFHLLHTLNKDHSIICIHPSSQRLLQTTHLTTVLLSSYTSCTTLTYFSATERSAAAPQFVF